MYDSRFRDARDGWPQRDVRVVRCRRRRCLQDGAGATSDVGPPAPRGTPRGCRRASSHVTSSAAVIYRRQDEGAGRDGGWEGRVMGCELTLYRCVRGSNRSSSPSPPSPRPVCLQCPTCGFSWLRQAAAATHAPQPNSVCTPRRASPSSFHASLPRSALPYLTHTASPHRARA